MSLLGDTLLTFCPSTKMPAGHPCAPAATMPSSSSLWETTFPVPEVCSSAQAASCTLQNAVIFGN